HVVELNNLISTSKLPEIADIYSEGEVHNAHLMIMKFDFTESPCPTAFDLTKDPCILHMPYEEEVLVLEHTSPTQGNPYERFMITFKYVPMTGGRTPNSFIWERSRLE
ncbi:unnamed protein product, partial [Didymodactylos carnosus]